MLIVIGLFIAAVVAAWVSAMLVIHALATKDLFFTFVPEGEIKFILAGDDLRFTFVNVTGYHYNKKTRKIEKLKNGEWPWFIKMFKPWKHGWFGAYGPFLSPIYSVHTYKFTFPEWEKKDVKTGEYKIKTRENEIANSMYHRFSYPLDTNDIETEGGLLVYFIGEAVFIAIDAERAILSLKAKWLAMATQLLRGYISDYCKDKNFPTLNKLDKGKGLWDFLNEKVFANPDSTKPMLTRLDELERVCGVTLEAYNFVAFGVSGAEKEILEAIRAKEIATRKGEGVIADAEAKAKAITSVGNARAAVAQQFSAAYGPDGAAAVASAQAYADSNVASAEVYARSIAEFDGQVLNLGNGAPTMVNLPIEPKKKGKT